MGYSQRLPNRYRGNSYEKSVSKQHPDKQNFHGNQKSQQNMYYCEQCFHLGPPQGNLRDDSDQFSSVSQLDDSVQFRSQVDW
jgi:hypothetical protein